MLYVAVLIKSSLCVLNIIMVNKTCFIAIVIVIESWYDKALIHLILYNISLECKFHHNAHLKIIIILSIHKTYLYYPNTVSCSDCVSMDGINSMVIYNIQLK